VKPAYWDAATRELGRRDRVMQRLIRENPGIHLRRRPDAFTALARAIVGQQISVAAAETVWRRFASTVAPRSGSKPARRVDPRVVSAQAPLALRACGLSTRKVEYLHDLSGHFISGALDPKRWKALDDEALIEVLCAVKGIGRWTAEMFLMFHELRADVLPVDDIGLRNAMARLYHGGERPSPAEMRERAATWRPYRSVATWYLWRFLDPAPIDY
jgi:DNA-3-methyladenine glycosylase II